MIENIHQNAHILSYGFSHKMSHHDCKYFRFIDITKVDITQIPDSEPAWIPGGIVRTTLGFVRARASPVNSQPGPTQAGPGSAHGMSQFWATYGIWLGLQRDLSTIPSQDQYTRYLVHVCPCISRTGPRRDSYGLERAVWAGPAGLPIWDFLQRY